MPFSNIVSRIKFVCVLGEIYERSSPWRCGPGEGAGRGPWVWSTTGQCLSALRFIAKKFVLFRKLRFCARSCAKERYCYCILSLQLNLLFFCLYRHLTFQPRLGPACTRYAVVDCKPSWVQTERVFVLQNPATTHQNGMRSKVGFCVKMIEPKKFLSRVFIAD